MYKRKLTALDFPNADGFSGKDELEFRKLILWLEDQKIRHYKIEDRAKLRKISAGDWEQCLQKYMDDLGCPASQSDRPLLIDWFLGYAVRLEYGDNVEKYRTSQVPGASPSASSNPLESLDFDDPEFKKGVESLASILRIPPHPNHNTQLKAICIFIRERLSKEAVARVEKEGVKSLKTIPIEKIDLGFETTDYITQEAAKILRLLYVRELRELQDGANQAIVAVQALTADPKTDTKLGKVGK